MSAKTKFNKAILLLGSNLNDRKSHISYGLSQIKEHVGQISKSSLVYESEAWGFKSFPFLNLVVIINTELEPGELLRTIKKIEKRSGRVYSKSDTYEARTLDIDVLFYNDQIINLPDLIVPHPKIQERKFTLLPLHEIIPDYIHPKLNATIEDLLENCEDMGKVEVFRVN